MSKRLALTLLSLAIAVTLTAAEPQKPGKSEKSDKPDKADKYGEKTFAGLELRNIGPAVSSGRILDLAVDPRDERVWYIATAGGGVWKTSNAGTTFEPLFDGEGSHSIGCVTIDQKDSLVVWVGTGDSN